MAQLSEHEIANIIKNGKGKMPGFKSLSQEDIDSLGSFIRELQRKN